MQEPTACFPTVIFTVEEVMLSPILRSTLLSEDPFTLSGIRSLLIRKDETDGQTTLYAASEATGTVTSFRLGEGDSLGAASTTSLLGSSVNFRAADMALIADGQDQRLVVSQIQAQQINTFSIGSGGSLGDQSVLTSPLGGPVTQVTSVEVGGRDFLVTGTRDASGLRIFEWAQDGVPVLRDTVMDQPKIALGNVSDIGSVTVNGTPYVINTSSKDGAISSFAFDGNGDARLIDTLGAKDGLWAAGLDALAMVDAHGASFVAIAGVNSSSLSLVRVNEMGVLFIEDHRTDDLNSRFYRADAVDGFSVGARGFVLAAGADDGITLAEIMPDYRLLMQGTLSNTVGGALSNITAITTAQFTNEVQVIAAGQPGIAQAVIDISNIAAPVIGTAAAESLAGGQGDDLLWAGPGNDTLSGGAGNDLMMGGAGSDRMTGGGGEDLFIMDPDTERDFIMDFAQGEDMIDVSRWGRIYDVQSLTIAGQSNGAEIRYGENRVRLFTDDGSALAADDFSNGDFLF